MRPAHFAALALALTACNNFTAEELAGDGALAVDIDDADFGSVSIHAASMTTLVHVKNTGDVATGKLAVELLGEDFQIVDQDCGDEALATQAECTLELRFEPTSAGPRVGALTIGAEPGGNVVTSLGGVGIATVAVVHTGDGSGTVWSNPGGITCGTECSHDFSELEVTLAASPAPGSTFIGWSGACTGDADCAIALDDDAQVAARFEPVHMLTVQMSGAGAGTVSSDGGEISCGGICTATLVEGASVTLHAAPLSGSTFGGWAGAGCSGTQDCTVTMYAASSVTATFDVDYDVLQVQKSFLGTGTGRITSSPGDIDCATDCYSASGNFLPGTTVTLYAEPDAGSYFAGWSNACSGVGDCVLNPVQEGYVATARFEQGHTLHIAVEGGDGGHISGLGYPCAGDCTKVYPEVTTVHLTRSVVPGYLFLGWGGACAFAGSFSACDIQVSGQVDVTAAFAYNPDCEGFC